MNDTDKKLRELIEDGLCPECLVFLEECECEDRDDDRMFDAN